MLRASINDIKRFFGYVEKLPNGCWYWTGARSRGKGNRKWYGSFRLGKQTVRAHRFSSEVLKGEECPPGHHRDHTCHFSMCVNPEHIEVVPKEINQERKVRRQAHARSEHNRLLARYEDPGRSGERHHC
jgi:hypothetical protein